MPRDFIVTVKEPFLAEWLRNVLGKADLPVLSPFPVATNFPGVPRQKAFMVDLVELGDDGRQKLIKASAKRYKMPNFIVEADLKRYGYPIPAELCLLRIDNPQRWL